LLIGKIPEAEQTLAQVEIALLPVTMQVIHALATANIAMRRTQANTARIVLARAESLARQAGIPALTAEVEHTVRQLGATTARLIAQGETHSMTLGDVEVLFRSPTFIVDACRHSVWCTGERIELATRPLLFSIARRLAEAWPNDVSRDVLIASAFRLKQSSESLRARLRVEMGRLRKLLLPVAEIHATPGGFISGTTRRK
jgi:hypothetical protein